MGKEWNLLPTCFFLAPCLTIQTYIFKLYVRCSEGQSTNFCSATARKVIKLVTRHFLLQFNSSCRIRTLLASHLQPGSRQLTRDDSRKILSPQSPREIAINDTCVTRHEPSVATRREQIMTEKNTISVGWQQFPAFFQHFYLTESILPLFSVDATIIAITKKAKCW